MSKKSVTGSIRLNGYDDLFGSGDTSGQNVQKPENQMVEIPLSDLHTFKNHPFRVVDDEKMEETTESIRLHGVLVPGIARPRAESRYVWRRMGGKRHQLGHGASGHNVQRWEIKYCL